MAHKVYLRNYFGSSHPYLLLVTIFKNYSEINDFSCDCVRNISTIRL